MNLQIHNQGQPLDPSSLKSAATASPSATTASNSTSLNSIKDTASISSLTGQLSADVDIRQDRVDALRSQVESGTYTVNAQAVATAMFQNLFRN